MMTYDFEKTRGLTEELCAPLTYEDHLVQAMPDVSPPKWHLAHTTWFFENFILAPFEKNFHPFDPRFAYLFNSYYESVGRFLEKPRRGVLSRPSVAEVLSYRRAVTERVLELLANTHEQEAYGAICQRLELGIQHEQQHQELLMTDIKYNFWSNPLRPAYLSQKAETFKKALAPQPYWIEFDEGQASIGHDGADFAFDNEGPAHPVNLRPFQLASRLVTNAEYKAFIADDGYTRPELWLSDGWLALKQERWLAPLYWEQQQGDSWSTVTLSGAGPLVDEQPVCHVSYYEADAFARWAGKRLPTEFEWEVAANNVLASTGSTAGNFLDARLLQPRPAQPGQSQLFGDAWEWSASAYLPYPGFKPLQGAVGEYNGKFMCNQMVLRGGSCVTPPGHIRTTYRNFFSAATRWQFSGLRLACDGR